ncbi:MAG: lamin tail domain-containing protein [Myxococcota bacterium]|nr:lamin tail domain-containing protein [Myxococcota bacterium]
MRILPSARGPAALLCSLLSLAAVAGDFRLAFIDVGQGDATVVISPSGCAAVLDGGPTGSGVEIKAYLKSQGITHVDFAVVSHYHADHLGGIDELDVGTDAVTVGAVYDRGGSYSSATYTAYAEHYAGKRRTLTRGEVFTLCSEVTFRVEAVNGNGISTTNENGKSVAVKLSYGSFDALVGGDLTSEAPNIEQTLVGQTGEVEVYKVHHHGSATSSGAELLNELKPTVSVISLGISNTYGHPTAEALGRLQAVGTTLYMTEDPATSRILGNVVVSSPTGAGYIVAQGGTSQTFASKGGGPVDLSAPSAPTNLVASASGTNGADLTWAASTDDVGVTGYRVYRSTSGGAFALAGTTPVTGFSESGLTPGVAYAYRVTAVDGAGNESAASNTAGLTLDTGADTQAPTAPASLSVSAAGSSTLVLTWSGASDNVGVTGYSLYRSLDGVSFTLHASTTGTEHTDSGLNAGTTYWYRVRAEDGAGNVSPESATASGTTATASPGKVIINEVLANEPGASTGGEFVELVNVGGTTFDLGGWTISDGSAVRHQFPTGTWLAPGKAIVVFASASAIPAGTPNAVGASTGQLNLNNTGETVSLSFRKKKQDSVSITAALASTDGVSANRGPDATAGAGMILHTGLSALGASPGTRPSGLAY